MFCSIANFYNTILSFMLFLKHNIEYSTINFDFSFQHPPIRIFSNRKPNFYSRYQIPPQERIVHPRVRKRKSRKTRRERNASSSLLVFFFLFARLCPQLLSLRFKFRLNYHEAERVCWRHDPGNKGWNESRNDRGG